MTGHTPGPWEWDRALEITHDGGLRRIADVADHTGVESMPETRWQANALLMAAAPELLAALEDIVPQFESRIIWSGSNPEYAAAVTSEARAAIAKAKGKIYPA